MGHANKGSSSQNNFHWQDGEVLPVVNGTLAVPDSYGFVWLTNAAATPVNIFDTEWFFGRVIEFTVAPGSAAFTFLRTGTGANIWTNGPFQVVSPNNTIRFRGVRNAAGDRIWLQVGFQTGQVPS